MRSQQSPKRRVTAKRLLRNFLNRFIYELENDEPIQGSDAVEAIQDLYAQVHRRRRVTRRRSRRTAAPLTPVRIHP